MPEGVTWVVKATFGPTCGNGRIEEGEARDGKVPAAFSCGSKGYQEGAIGCTPALANVEMWTPAPAIAL